MSTLVILAVMRAQAALPAMVAETVAGEARQIADLAEYTFEYESVYEEFSAAGKQTQRVVMTGEVYMSARGSVEVALTRNGRPLKGRDLAKERRAAAAKLEADANSRRSGGATENRDIDGRVGVGMTAFGLRMSAMDVLRYCSLRETARTEGFLELAFEKCRSPWPEEHHYALLTGEMRLDLVRRRVERWKARVNGQVFFEQTTQLAPGGQRVLAHHRLDGTAAPRLIRGRPRAVSYRWMKPQRFEVGVEQRVEPPAPGVR